MPNVLFFTGSLAPKGMAQCLAAERGEVVALEFDTLLDRQRYPNVSHWLTLRDAVSRPEISALSRQVVEIMDFFLRDRPEVGDGPLDAALRKAALGGAFQDLAFVQLLNTTLRDYLWKHFRFDRLVLTPGSGVSYKFWRAVAASEGLSLEVLQPEWRGRSLGRRLERWWYKSRKRKPGAVPPPEGSPALVEETSGAPVVCASSRIARLLQQEEQQPPFPIIQVSASDLGAPDPATLAAEAQRQGEWWRRWQELVLEPACASEGQPEAARFKDLYQRMGTHFSREVYPEWAALKRNAVAWLQARKPAAVLWDTQIGQRETIWCLAAAELGIPVIGHTYDFSMTPKTMFTPDYLVIDGMRSIPKAVEGGYPRERMIEVRSHRCPSTPRRTEMEIDASFTKRRPTVLCADTMTLLTDPQACLRSYLAIIGAARRLPHLDFIVKYHPLRTGKSEERSFLGMDESEVQAKTGFIRGQRPPANLSIMPPEATMEECLKTASILLNTISLTGHEAFHLGIPVVFMTQHEPDCTMFPQLADWLQPLHAETEDELVSALDQLVNSREFRHRHIAAQHRYHDEFFWKSKVPLTEALTQAVQRSAQEPLLAK